MSSNFQVKWNEQSWWWHAFKSPLIHPLHVSCNLSLLVLISYCSWYFASEQRKQLEARVREIEERKQRLLTQVAAPPAMTSMTTSDLRIPSVDPRVTSTLIHRYPGMSSVDPVLTSTDSSMMYKPRMTSTNLPLTSTLTTAIPLGLPTQMPKGQSHCEVTLSGPHTVTFAEPSAAQEARPDAWTMPPSQQPAFDPLGTLTGPQYPSVYSTVPGHGSEDVILQRQRARHSSLQQARRHLEQRAAELFQANQAVLLDPLKVTQLGHFHDVELSGSTEERSPRERYQLGQNAVDRPHLGAEADLQPPVAECTTAQSQPHTRLGADDHQPYSSRHVDHEQASLSPRTEQDQPPVRSQTDHSQPSVSPRTDYYQPSSLHVDQKQPSFSPRTAVNQPLVSPGVSSRTEQNQASVSPRTDQYQASVSPRTDQYQASVSPRTGQYQASDSPRTDQYQASVGPRTDQYQASVDPRTDQYQASVSANTDQYQASDSPRTDQYQASVSPRTDQYQASVSPRTDQYQASVSPRTDQYQASVSPRTDQYQASVDPRTDQYQASVSPRTDQYQASVGPRTDQYQASVGPRTDHYHALGPPKMDQYDARQDEDGLTQASPKDESKLQRIHDLWKVDPPSLALHTCTLQPTYETLLAKYRISSGLSMSALPGSASEAPDTGSISESATEVRRPWDISRYHDSAAHELPYYPMTSTGGISTSSKLDAEQQSSFPESGRPSSLSQHEIGDETTTLSAPDVELPEEYKTLRITDEEQDEMLPLQHDISVQLSDQDNNRSHTWAPLQPADDSGGAQSLEPLPVSPGTGRTDHCGLSPRDPSGAQSHDRLRLSDQITVVQPVLRHDPLQFINQATEVADKQTAATPSLEPISAEPVARHWLPGAGEEEKEDEVESQRLSTIPEVDTPRSSSTGRVLVDSPPGSPPHESQAAEGLEQDESSHFQVGTLMTDFSSIVLCWNTWLTVK